MQFVRLPKVLAWSVQNSYNGHCSPIFSNPLFQFNVSYAAARIAAELSCLLIQYGCPSPSLGWSWPLFRVAAKCEVQRESVFSILLCCALIESLCEYELWQKQIFHAVGLFEQNLWIACLPFLEIRYLSALETVGNRQSIKTKFFIFYCSGSGLQPCHQWDQRSVYKWEYSGSRRGYSSMFV